MLKKIKLVFLSAALALFGLIGTAHAELDPSVATSMAEIKADATSLMGIVMPIVIAIMGMLITIKLVKKFGNKV